jgi:glycosyltransferase involved in cell wall biosynthesis
MIAPAPGRNLLALSAPFGGIEVWFRSLQGAFASHPGWNVAWEWISYSPADRIAHLPFVSSRWEWKAGLVGRVRYRNRLRALGRLDAVIANHMLPLTFLAGISSQTPLVLSLDATPEMMASTGRWYVRKAHENRPRLSNVLRRELAGLLYRRCRALLPWSEEAKDSLVRTYGVDPRAITVIPPGLDLAAWKAPDRSMRRGPVKFLFVGGAFERKGGDLLLRTMADAAFSGCQLDIATRDEVRSPGPNVRVHSDVMPGTDRLRELYREADVLVLPTRADFAPTNTVIEAMASGLPVVTSDVGGLSRVVADGQTGYIVPAGNRGALASRLGALAGDGALRKRMGMASRRYAEEHFSLAVNASHIVSVLDGLVAPRKEG